MDDSGVRQGRHCRADLQEPLAHLVRRRILGQGPETLHRNPGPALPLTRAKDPHDVVVADPDQQLRLTGEAFDTGRIAFAKDLQGAFGSEIRIDRRIHLAGRTEADVTGDLESVDVIADGERIAAPRFSRHVADHKVHERIKLIH